VRDRLLGLTAGNLQRPRAIPAFASSKAFADVRGDGLRRIPQLADVQESPMRSVEKAVDGIGGALGSVEHIEVAVWHDRRMGTGCTGPAIPLSLRQSVPFAAPFGSLRRLAIAPFGSCGVSRLRSLAARAVWQFAPF
jgi:hypothetical protein